MSDLALNETTWDLEIENGDLVLLSQDEAIKQLLRQRLGLFLGEWFLDSSKGIPYFQSIFIKGAQLPILDALFKQVILETPGIVELQRFVLDFDQQERTFAIDLKARHTRGVVEFNEEITI